MILTDIAILQLEELSAVIEQLSEADYTAALPLLDHVSLGKHVRHTLEFHQCFLDRKEQLCYDDRSREIRLEESPAEALEQIALLVYRLRFIQLDKVFEMKVQYGNSAVSVTSSVQRELAFLIEHTVHHNAILRMALTMFYPHVQFNQEFGYADSTIRYLQQNKTAV